MPFLPAGGLTGGASRGRSGLGLAVHPRPPLSRGRRAAERGKLARGSYGAGEGAYTRGAETDIGLLSRHGFERPPTGRAKTAVALSDTARPRGRPRKFRLTVNEPRVSAGAGFVVVICGNIMTMPGLPREPAAHHICLGDDGLISGLS